MTEDEQPNPKLQAALTLLHEGVATLTSSEGWQEALKLQRHFHHYSFQNTLLIYFQRPDARLVAGFHTWRKLGRWVKKGEHGITILAPLLRKTEDDEEELYGFRTAHVFDVEQTEGEPLPESAKPQVLTADSPPLLTTKLEALAKDLGLSLEEKANYPAFGSHKRLAKRITLRAGLPPLQRFKTLTHELAHALLHGGEEQPSREIGELEAESTAFLVCHQLGLDTSSYSFAYLAHWGGGNSQELLKAGQRACTCAERILKSFIPIQSNKTTT